jgi:hypothetical protein
MASLSEATVTKQRGRITPAGRGRPPTQGGISTRDGETLHVVRFDTSGDYYFIYFVGMPSKHSLLVFFRLD